MLPLNKDMPLATSTLWDLDTSDAVRAAVGAKPLVVSKAVEAGPNCVVRHITTTPTRPHTANIPMSSVETKYPPARRQDRPGHLDLPLAPAEDCHGQFNHSG